MLLRVVRHRELERLGVEGCQRGGCVLWSRLCSARVGVTRLVTRTHATSAAACDAPLGNGVLTDPTAGWPSPPGGPARWRASRSSAVWQIWPWRARGSRWPLKSHGIGVSKPRSQWPAGQRSSDPTLPSHPLQKVCAHLEWQSMRVPLQAATFLYTCHQQTLGHLMFCRCSWYQEKP